MVGVTSIDIAILALRLGLALILYAFVVAVMRAASHAWVTVDVPVASALTAREQPETAPARGTGLRLQVLEPGATDWREGEVVLVAEPGPVGRSPDSALVVPDPTVSGRHARLAEAKGRWSVADLGSTNGTRVGDHLIPAGTPVPLPPGEMLTLGGVRLRVLA